jgi:secreted PhoX family phosphatase
MGSPAKGSSSRQVRIVLLPALLGCGLLAACNFPSDDGANVGSKGLWVANGTNVVEYNPSQLSGGTGATAPHVSINSAAFGTPQGVAFDPNGNLWVLDPAGMVNGAATPALFEFSAGQLAALATDNAPEPVAIITSTFLKTPRQAVIDVLGNAWITDPTSNMVMVYTAAQLAQTGTNVIAPAVAIASAQFSGPSGVAFDSSGDLWISNNGVPATAADQFGGGTTIVEIAAAHVPALPETGTSTPQLVSDVTLSDAGQVTIQSPWALAFDPLSGNLWSSNTATSTLVAFGKTTLVTAAPAAAATVSSTTVNADATLNQPHGICFDDVGNLAAIDEAGGTKSFAIAVFGPGQLATGSPAPLAFIVGDATTLNAPEGCAFGPTVN